MDKIPKIIHQIWIGPNKNPTVWTNTWSIDYINTFKDFEYKLWNNNNINDILNKYPLCKIIFNMEKEYCGKADILRYLILHEYGGIYIDADSVWLNNKNLNNLIEKTNDTGIFCGKEPTSEYIANGVIGCTKNNKIMLKLINNLENYIRYYDRIKPRQYKRKRAILGCSKLTGPRFFSLIMIPEKITIFPSNYFYPISWFGITEIDKHKKIEISQESYMFQYGYTTNKLGNII